MLRLPSLSRQLLQQSCNLLLQGQVARPRIHFDSLKDHRHHTTRPHQSQMKRKRWAWDSLDAASSRERTWPPGPVTLDELYDWPRRNAKAISCDAEKLCRMTSNFMNGIHLYSDYSGSCCDKEALLRSWDGIKHVNTLGDLTCPLYFERACDIGKTQLGVLCDISRLHTGGRMCVFNDLMKRCDAIAQQWLQAAAPSESSTPQEIQASYASMLSWLWQNRSWALRADLTQHCLVHNKQCPVHPSSKRTAPEASAPSSTLKYTTEAACPGSGRDPLWVHFAGVTCDGWSTIGSQQRLAHKSEMPHNVYVAERKVRGEEGLEDLAFTECTPNYPVKHKMQEPLSGTHKVVWVVTGPEFLGYPVHRRRVLSASICMRRCAWVGPEDPTEEFRSLFYQATRATGDMLLCGPNQDRVDEYQALAATQSNYIDKEDIPSMDTERLMASVLSPGQHRRFQMWASVERDTPLVTDLDHNPETRMRGGLLWPVQLTHGLVCAFPVGSQPKLATPLEHWGAHGFHLFDSTTKTCAKSSMLPIFTKLSRSKLKELSGRGIHVAVLSAWMMYVLSNIVRVDRKENIRVMKGLSWEELAMSDDERQERTDC